MRFIFRGLVLLVLLPMTIASPAQMPDTSTRLASQRAAMARLARLDGVWRGRAWTLTRSGRHDVVHTERVGTFLGGTVRMIEGRSYAEDLSVGFNALGVISFEPDTGAYTFNSWAMGRAGAFSLRLTDNGYVWELPAGPGAVLRYTATIERGHWRETGERIAANSPPLQVFEMNLDRVSPTLWPGEGAVPPR